MKLAAGAAAALALSAFGAWAEEIGPGSHFIANGDQDGNGSVTLAEATERRELVFTAFDANEDGMLSDAEYALFDEMRATDQAAAQEEVQAAGKGHGKDHGKGMGHGNGEDAGMQRGFNDVDGDGKVSRDEFLSRTPDWFAKMDRDGSGNVTAADFGLG